MRTGVLAKQVAGAAALGALAHAAPMVTSLGPLRAAVFPRLTGLGVEFLNGPVDRPWGIRTASFRDPGGHVWEIAH